MKPALVLDFETPPHSFGGVPQRSSFIGEIPCSEGIPVVTRIKTFPKTRYYGSKKRLLQWIYDSTKHLTFKSVVDVFGGTASVSLLFKAMGKSVTYNDALISNCVAASALLSEFNPLHVDEMKCFVKSVEPIEGFISKTFAGMYYTDEENRWLDGCISKIRQFECKDQQNLLLYCLFQACLQKRPFNLFHRANLNLRLNEGVQRTFGNHVTWNKSFGTAMFESFESISNMVWRSTEGCFVLPPSDAFQIKPVYDLVYLDPPYVDLSSRHDDYLKRYHFLEGICRYHEWEKLIDFSSRSNTMLTQPHIKDWHRKKQIKQMLFDLIKVHSNSIVVLSYLANVYPTEDEIVEEFKSLFRNVYVHRHKLNHALAKDQKIELLFVGVP